jgi:hypothetical protein
LRFNRKTQKYYKSFKKVWDLIAKHKNIISHLKKIEI